MTKGHYYFNRSLRGYDFEDAGTNRREAIRQGRYYVGSLEYPYYLSTACTITSSDITVNI